MNYCKCKLCKEFTDKNNILYETKNLFVVPSVGQIVEGYLLICSKQHYIGFGDLPEKIFPELERVQKLVRRILSKNYDVPIFFEHGPVSIVKKGGCCVEHAHFHAVPANIDILKELSKHFRPEIIDSLLALKTQFKSGNPYFFYENPTGQRYIFSITEIIPSQYIRKIIAAKLGMRDKWDWKKYPEIEKFSKTIQRLKNDFLNV